MTSGMKEAVKYQLWEYKTPLIIYYIARYGFVMLLRLFVEVAVVSAGGEVQVSSVGGLEFASIIFIFVAGLNSFRETFHIFIQHGISRRRMFVSFLLLAAPVAAFMALTDSLNWIASGLFSGTNVTYESIFMQIYAQDYTGTGSAALFLTSFLWGATVYLSFVLLGYMITALYYRMNKPLKIAVSVGLPVFFTVVLPLIESQVTKGAIFAALGNYIKFSWGGPGPGADPLYAIAFSLLHGAVFALISWLLIRRAEFKPR